MVYKISSSSRCHGLVVAFLGHTHLLRGQLYSKFSFVEVYRRIYSPKFSFMVKRDFRPYIRRYTSPNENFEYGYSHSNDLLQFYLNFEHSKPHNAAVHLTECVIINDFKLFLTVYHRIFCRKFLTLSNQTSCYKSKFIRTFYEC